SMIGAFNTQYHILQRLRIDLRICRHSLFDAGQFSFLLVVADGDAAHPPRLTPLTDGGIVDLATQHQGTLQQPLLSEGRFESIRVGFTDTLLFHTILFCLIGAQPANIGTIVPLASRPTFIPVPRGSRSQPDPGYTASSTACSLAAGPSGWWCVRIISTAR